MIEHRLAYELRQYWSSDPLESNHGARPVERPTAVPLPRYQRTDTERQGVEAPPCEGCERSLHCRAWRATCDAWGQYLNSGGWNAAKVQRNIRARTA